VSTRAEELAIRPISRMAGGLSRGEYFGGLLLVSCASGVASRIIHSVADIGWAQAFFRTFDVSAIVWFSCIAGLSLIAQDHTKGVRWFEIAAGAVFIPLIILPVDPLSWIAVTGLSVYILLFSDIAASRRGASILLAVTVPMLWGRVLFHFFADYILAADGLLVSWLLGTHRTGNLVEFADKSGQLVIFERCSSLANVSLALLCWVTLSRLVSHKSRYDFLWCLLACTAVVAVNVTRMTILGQSEWHYATLHNQWGDAAANIIMLGLIFGICTLGVRRELFQRV
jgi:exosortase/archaeosortase family protein